MDDLGEGGGGILSLVQGVQSDFYEGKGVFGAKLIVSRGETLTNYGVLGMLHLF